MVGTFMAKTVIPILIRVEPIEDEKCFADIRDWIEAYLQYTSSHPDGWYESYKKNRDFWLVLPEVVWALSWRRFVAFLRVVHYIC